MKTLRMTTLVPFTALLLALLAMTPITARAAEAATSSGNIIENRITSVTINPATSVATIRGTVQCSTLTQLTVYSTVRQSHGQYKHLAEYFGATEVACGTTPTPYAITVTPGYESDKLVPGRASSNTWAEYCTTSGCYGFGTDSDMRLRPDR